jgi:phytoene dehydrogenase-like protein
LFDYDLAKQFKDPNKYDDFKAWCLNQIIKTLSETALKGLAKHVVYKSCSTPLTIEARTGNTDGAITGWSFLNLPIPAEHRFKKIRNSINTPIQDVLQCGQWTFSPAGFPVSILTGKLTADSIKKSLKK